MANIAVTNSFVASTSCKSGEVNQNFNDIVNGLSDGTKDINISSAAFNDMSCKVVDSTGDFFVYGGLDVAASCNVSTFDTLNGKVRAGIVSLGEPDHVTINPVFERVTSLKNFIVVSNSSGVNTFSVLLPVYTTPSNTNSPYVVVLAEPIAESELMLSYRSTYVTMTSNHVVCFHMPEGTTSVYPGVHMRNE
jgi:hypothetical protein